MGTNNSKISKVQVNELVERTSCMFLVECRDHSLIRDAIHGRRSSHSGRNQRLVGYIPQFHRFIVKFPDTLLCS
jgi:hypothetical protein